jgi:glycosyltransferase involved in cell wall biosynthesis
VVFEPVRITDRPRPVGDIAAVLRLRRLLRQADLDVVHAHGLRAGALAALALRPSSAIRLLGIGPPDAAGPGDKRLGVLRPGTRPPRARQVGGGRPALLVTVHNAPPDTRRAAAVYARLERLVGGEADAVLGVSADLCARMRRLGAHEVRAAVVAAPAAAQPGPADLPDLRAGGRPVVLAAGRLARQKGFGVLIEAAACWRDRRPEPVILIAGDGPLAAELAGLARDVGVDARLLGVRHDVPALLAAADVFVLPSNWEGQPLVLQEALRAGRPIVAADVGGIPALTGPDAALLVPPGDAAALAEAVLAVLDDRELAGRLAKAALERAGRLPSESDAVSAARAEYDRLTPSPR